MLDGAVHPQGTWKNPSHHVQNYTPTVSVFLYHWLAGHLKGAVWFPSTGTVPVLWFGKVLGSGLFSAVESSMG